MAFLSNSDFKPDDLDIPKTLSGGPYKGKYRTKAVYLKIKDNKKFNLGVDGKGEDVTGLRLLTKAGKDLPKKKNTESGSIIVKKTFVANFPYQLEYKKGRSPTKHQISITKVFKDLDLGGKPAGGVDPNAKKITINTAQQEQISALICSAVLSKTKKWKSFLEMYNAKASGLQKIHPGLKIKGAPYEKDDWWKHFVLQFENIETLTGLKKGHFEEFNRDGGFMDFISKLVTSGKGGSLLAKDYNRFAEKDSWNPADIWLLDTSPTPAYKKLMEELESAKTIAKINDALRIAFTNQVVVGISLKKSGGKGGQIFYEKVNLYNTTKAQKLPSVKIDRIEFDPYFDGQGFPSVTSNIFFKDNEQRVYKLIFRRNDPGVTDITYEFAELQMKHQMGKVPKDRFKLAIQDHLGKNIEYPGQASYTTFAGGSTSSGIKSWKTIKTNANKILKESGYRWTVGDQSKNRVKPERPTGVKKKDWDEKQAKAAAEEAEKKTMANTAKAWKDFLPNLEKSWKVGGKKSIKWGGNSTMMQMVDFLNILQLLIKKLGKTERKNKKIPSFEEVLTEVFYYAQKKGQKWDFGPFGKLY